MNPEKFEIFIACIPGLERELLAEIKQIGFNQTKLMVGGVIFFWRLARSLAGKFLFKGSN